MKAITCLVCLALSSSLTAGTLLPTIEAKFETTPIPKGKTHTDDAAIWWNAAEPSQSLILGTSKYDKDGQGGLGVYNLAGDELQFLKGSKLNSVDLIGNLAVATNRSDKSLDFFAIQNGEVKRVGRQALTSSLGPNSKASEGQAIEPYGLCLGEASAESFMVYLPFKNGHLLAYEVQKQQPFTMSLRHDIDLSALVSSEQDEKLKAIVQKAAAAEGELDELDEAIAERFILEGCVYDSKRKQLYVGMENLGVWSLPVGSNPEAVSLLFSISGSWTEVADWSQQGLPRLTDDIEGLDLISKDGRDFLFISVQGLSEFALFDLSSQSWVGNFKISFGDDLVSQTDGITLAGNNFGALFPMGLLLVHDDRNTAPEETANYKAVSLEDVWQALPYLGGSKSSGK